MALRFSPDFIRPLRLSDELRDSIALTVGPVLLYGTNGGKMRLGAALGLCFKL